jgi:hypothetical protein
LTSGRIRRRSATAVPTQDRSLLQSVGRRSGRPRNQDGRAVRRHRDGAGGGGPGESLRGIAGVRPKTPVTREQPSARRDAERMNAAGSHHKRSRHARRARCPIAVGAAADRGPDRTPVAFRGEACQRLVRRLEASAFVSTKEWESPSRARGARQALTAQAERDDIDRRQVSSSVRVSSPPSGARTGSSGRTRSRGSVGARAAEDTRCPRPSQAAPGFERALRALRRSAENS